MLGSPVLDLEYFNSHLLATLNVTRLRRLFSEQNKFPHSLVSEAYSYYNNLYLAFLSHANFRREKSYPKQMSPFHLSYSPTFFLTFFFFFLSYIDLLAWSDIQITVAFTANCKCGSSAALLLPLLQN